MILYESASRYFENDLSSSGSSKFKTLMGNFLAMRKCFNDFLKGYYYELSCSVKRFDDVPCAVNNARRDQITSNICCVFLLVLVGPFKKWVEEVLT